MEWENIDNVFKDCERIWGRSPTTDELVKGIMKFIEESRWLFDGYKIKVNENE